VYLLKYCFTI